MLTCTVAVGPGMVAVGVPANATKSRKPTPSKQLATESLSSSDTVTVSPAWNVVLLVPIVRSPATTAAEPDRDLEGLGRLERGRVDERDGRARRHGRQPGRAERQACRHRRERCDALPPHVASPWPTPVGGSTLPAYYPRHACAKTRRRGPEGPLLSGCRWTD